MKKKNIFVILFYLFIYNSVHSQTLSIKGYFQGEVKDEVILGLNSNASLSIDSILGEKDISSDSLDEYDIRILQRNENNFDCLFNLNQNNHNTPIFFENSFDSKINFRNIFETNYTFFEIKNLSQNFDSFVLTSDSIPLNHFIKKVWTYSDECNLSTLLISNFENISSPINNFEFLMFPTQSLDQFIDRFVIEFDSTFILANSIDKKEIRNIKVFPNPALEYVVIENFNIQKNKLKMNLYNINGLFQSNYLLTDKINKIDISSLVQGIYFLEIIDNKNNRIYHHKLIKK
jgi:hypothetical protein